LGEIPVFLFPFSLISWFFLVLIQKISGIFLITIYRLENGIMNSLSILNNEILIDAYHEAYRQKLSHDFIEMLKTEIIKRNLPMDGVTTYTYFRNPL